MFCLQLNVNVFSRHAFDAKPLRMSLWNGTGIVRYLAGRFPETTSAVDDNGRTALHYAATLKDNGHFYNMLTHLGANPKAEDNVSNVQ